MLMEMYMKVIGSITKLKEKVFTFIMTDHDTKEIGRMIYKKVKE